MKHFRGKYSRKIFVVLTGLAFLNMGFILAEIETMGLTKNSPLIQNLIRSGAEEEKESSKTSLDDLKGVYLNGEGNGNYQNIFYLIEVRGNNVGKADKPLAPYIAEFCPPPEAC